MTTPRPNRRVAQRSRAVIIVLIAAPLLGGIIAWFGASAWSSSAVRASAVVDLAPVIRGYTAFEVATHAADFASAYDDGRSAGGDEDEGQAGALTDANRTGESTRVRVSFVSPKAVDAEAGLRKAAANGLDAVVGGLLEQSKARLAGALNAQAALRAIEQPGENEQSTPEQDRVEELTAEARVDVATLEVVRKSVPALVERIPVEQGDVSNTTARLRTTLAAALSAFVIALGLVVLRASRRSAAESDQPDA